MKRLLTLPALGFIIVAAIGCGQNGDPTQPSSAPAIEGATASWPATLPTDRGSFNVTLGPIGGAIERSRHFSLEVAVESAEKADLADPIVVSVDADMPAHRHGMNTQPELVKNGDLRYRVNGMLFHMAGEWVINVDITMGDTTERATFPVSVE